SKDRTGTLSLRGLHLSKGMFGLVKREEVSFYGDVRGVGDGGEEVVKRVGEGVWRVAVGECVEVECKVVNRKETPARLILRTLPLQDTDTAPLISDSLTTSPFAPRGIVSAGKLETILRVLDPGESETHKVRFVFTSRGRVRVVVHGEVVGVAGKGLEKGEVIWGGEGLVCEVVDEV
ncbi:hypothetical protein HK097_009204, partial [Rhizophlyctis rosea]